MHKWYFNQVAKGEAYDIHNPNAINTYVCSVCSKEEARTIVNCVNSHEEMVETFEEILKNNEECPNNKGWWWVKKIPTSEQLGKIKRLVKKGRGE